MDLNQPADLDMTIAALQQGATTIPPEQAIAILDSWQQQLRGLAIANDLGALKEALQNQKSAQALSNLLIGLGEDTAGELTIETSDETNAKIKQLRDLLREAGTQLRDA